MSALRTKAAYALAWLYVHISPDPAVTFSIKRPTNWRAGPGGRTSSSQDRLPMTQPTPWGFKIAMTLFALFAFLGLGSLLAGDLDNARTCWAFGGSISLGYISSKREREVT